MVGGADSPLAAGIFGSERFVPLLKYCKERLDL